jgi:hypothetical protein
MKETLISFKVAKLAKEKGFDWETQKVYDANETNIKNPTIYIYGEDLSGDDELYAPTKAELQSWLRINHDIEVNVVKCWTSSDDWEYGYSIEYIANPTTKKQCNMYKIIESFNDGIGSYSNKVTDSSNWNKVLEDGLYEGLKLIKI